MSQYASPKRKLPWELLWPAALNRTTEDVTEVASSFVWPANSDERVYVVFKLSLNEYNVLASTIDVGSDIAYSDDAIRVMWLWQRNFIDGTVNLTVGDDAMACCEPSVSETVYTQTYITNTTTSYTTNIEQYNTDGLATIAPNMLPSNTSQEGIDEILCIGLKMLVRAIVNEANAIKNGTSAQQSQLTSRLAGAFGSLSAAGSIAMTVGGPAAGLVGFLGGPWLLLGLALAGVGLSIASIIQSVSAEVFNDENAIDDVVCAMHQEALGQTPEFEVFRHLLDGASFPAGSNAEKLASIVEPYLQSIEVYAQFIINMSDLYAVWTFPEGGAGCDCEEPLDPNCVDLTAAPNGWFAGDAGGNPNSNFGVWIDGEGAAPNQSSNGFFWLRSATPGLYASEITVTFNQPVTNIAFALLNGGLIYAHSGSAQISFTMNESNAPNAFPVNLEAYAMYVTFDFNVAPNASVRMEQVCITPVE